MKVSLKNVGFDAEGDAEGIIKKALDNHEKDWQKKHKAKKEIMELKHKQKMELLDRKRENSFFTKIIQGKRKREEEVKKIEAENENKRIIKIFDIIFFVFYGIIFAARINDGRIALSIISIIQEILFIISFLVCEDIFNLFKKDYKILFYLGLFLTIPWLIFFAQ